MAEPGPAPSAPPRLKLASVLRQFRTLPNQLTGVRLLLLPLLWVLVVQNRAVWVGIGLAIAGLTDVLDGYLSRRWKQTSTFGSRLDSAADHLLAISATLWLAMLRPQFLLEQKWALIAWSAFALGVLVVSWLRFRRFVDLHLYSAKVAVFMAFSFAVPLLLLGGYSRVHFWLAWLAATFAAAEALWVIVAHDQLDAGMRSVVFRRRR